MLKFGMNQWVVSKKTGLPMVGHIHGITTGVYQDWVFRCRGQKTIRWDDLYPDWREKFVYIVVFDTPGRTCSYEEYISLESTKFHDKATYEQNIPIQSCATYPEDDLEVFDMEIYPSSITNNETGEKNVTPNIR